MKRLSVIIAILILSVFFVSTSQIDTQQVKKNTIQQQDTLKSTMLKNQKIILKNQDTLKRNTKAAKNAEYLDWQYRSQKIDKNFEKMDKQSAIMDSLINAKPKLIKKKTP